MALTVKKSTLRVKRPTDADAGAEADSLNNGMDGPEPVIIRRQGPSYVPYVIMGILALLVFGAAVLLQALELKHYYDPRPSFPDRVHRGEERVAEEGMVPGGEEFGLDSMEMEALKVVPGVAAGGMAVMLGTLGVPLLLVLLLIVSLWRIFTKAGQPGWASIVPIYNAIVFIKVAGRPLWWFILLLIPLIQIIPWIVLNVDLARNFGKGVGFGIGLFILPIIFYPVLAFGKATYAGAEAAE